MAAIKKGYMYSVDIQRCQQNQVWFRFMLHVAGDIKIAIHDPAGDLQIELEVGDLPPGFYTTRGKSCFWDRRDSGGNIQGIGTGYYAKFYIDTVLQNIGYFSLD